VDVTVFGIVTWLVATQVMCCQSVNSEMPRAKHEIHRKIVPKRAMSGRAAGKG
jgi:hypothetical protein